MSKCKNALYNEETFELYKKLFPNGYITNRYYKQNDGVYAYVNQYGYIHIIRLQKLNMEDSETGKKRFLHYVYNDYLITKDGNVKDYNCFGNFETIAEGINFIEEGENYEKL